MALWPFAGTPGRPVDQAYSSSAQSSTAVVASATPHTMGAWTELKASTAAPWCGFVVNVGGTAASGVDSSSLLDIGIGGAGAEVVIVDRLNISGLSVYKSVPDVAVSYLLPLLVPAGARVAARVQSAVTSKSVSVHVYGLTAVPDGPLYSRMTTYGAVSGSSCGTDVVCGNNTLGSWAEVTASTTAPVDALMVSLGIGHTATVAATVAGFVEVGVGAAGSEVSLSRDFARWGTSETVNPHPAYVVPWRIPTGLPEGVRLAIAGSVSGSTPTFDAAVHAFTL